MIWRKSPKLNWKYVRQYSAALSAINSQGPKLVHLPPETCSSFIIKNTANHYQRQVGSEHKKFTSSTSTLHKYSCIFYNPFLVRYSAWIQLIEVELKNLIALEKQEKKTGACPISLLYGFCHILIVNPKPGVPNNYKQKEIVNHLTPTLELIITPSPLTTTLAISTIK